MVGAMDSSRRLCKTGTTAVEEEIRTKNLAMLRNMRKTSAAMNSPTSRATATTPRIIGSMRERGEVNGITLVVLDVVNSLHGRKTGNMIRDISREREGEDSLEPMSSNHRSNGGSNSNMIKTINKRGRETTMRARLATTDASTLGTNNHKDIEMTRPSILDANKTATSNHLKAWVPEVARMDRTNCAKTANMNIAISPGLSSDSNPVERNFLVSQHLRNHLLLHRLRALHKTTMCSPGRTRQMCVNMHSRRSNRSRPSPSSEPMV